MLKTVVKAAKSKDDGQDELFDSKQKRVLRHLVLHDHLSFLRWSMKERLGFKIEVAKFHHVLCDTIDRVISGEIKRLIINIPPGFTKTEAVAIAFMARGLAINPRSQFIHLSYADDLALGNSGKVKEIVESDYFQELFPMTLKVDAKSKKGWYNTQGGGVKASSSGGQVTGFRAGQYQPAEEEYEFSGAMIIDDPIKPDDAFSEPKRRDINNRFMNTFKSRLMDERTPMIVIMQRIHEDDPTAFLLRGGSGDKWHHLLLPAIIGDEAENYPEDFTHAIPINHGLEKGALWAYKKTEKDMEDMRAADPYTAASQYDQTPTPLGGGMFKSEWWQFYNPEHAPQFTHKFITADTASKLKQENDFSVFQCWGRSGSNIYLIDQVRGKWEAPDLEKVAKNFIRHHYGSGMQTVGRLRKMLIEDKSSGTGLIQSLQRWEEISIDIVGVSRNRDKVSRANDYIPFIAQGRVYLPEGATFLKEFILEFSKFTAIMSHKHDDIVDPTLDAIQEELAPAQKVAATW